MGATVNALFGPESEERPFLPLTSSCETLTKAYSLSLREFV